MSFLRGAPAPHVTGTAASPPRGRPECARAQHSASPHAAHTQPVCVTVGAACARNIRDRRCWCDTCLTVGNDVRDTRVTVGNDARSACGRREQCVFRVS